MSFDERRNLQDGCDLFSFGPTATFGDGYPGRHVSVDVWFESSEILCSV